nr:HipA domain-containing protein [uncultured Albidiferax sp.]
MAHELLLLAGNLPVASLRYTPQDDQWALRYAPTWLQSADAFPLSPALPLLAPATGYAPGSVKRFVENLLPEGRALDISASTYNLSTSNIFGLIHALGVETSGAFRFWPMDAALPSATASPALREVTLTELDARLAQRGQVPFVLWDHKVRMSIAGYQDKMLVYIDQGRLFLAEPPLASTHILKPQPQRADMPHLVINEHFCMALARRIGLPVAATHILRTPQPVLVVQRFDRLVLDGQVRRLHVIDACQACDLPVGLKYERNLGSGETVRHIREGVSFEMLFARVAQTTQQAVARLTLLRWALFQFVIGNSDAHGKNFSFFVHSHGLEPAPWYDLVSVVQYPGISHELAMAFGNVFNLEEVKSFALADFAKRCGIDRSLLKREAARMAKRVLQHAPLQAVAGDYQDDEQAFAAQLSAFVQAQATRLAALGQDAARIKDDFL